MVSLTPSVDEPVVSSYRPPLMKMFRVVCQVKSAENGERGKGGGSKRRVMRGGSKRRGVRGGKGVRGEGGGGSE